MLAMPATLTSNGRPRSAVSLSDCAIAAITVGAQLATVSGTPLFGGSGRPLDPLGYALVVLGGGVLVGSRHRPLPVLGVTVATTLAYILLGFPDGMETFPVCVALFMATAHGDGKRSIPIGLVVLGLITGGLLLAPGRSLVGFLRYDVLFEVVGVGGAALVGEWVRVRWAAQHEAEKRAERAERSIKEAARRRADAERLRIAREVHDTVAHAIALINVQAGVTAHVLDKRPEEARRALLTIQEASAGALRELRATLGVLRQVDEGGDGGSARTPPGRLDELERLASRAREAGLTVELALHGTARPLPVAVEHGAYRIVQESVTNTLRHAGPAARAWISVTYGEDGLELRVDDDGGAGVREPAPARAGDRSAEDAGRSPAAAGDTGTGTAAGVGAGTGSGSGNGVVGMRERAILLGGTLTAGPRPGGGFRVEAYLPAGR
jgi:signal transduction histidine kinase